MSRWAVAYVVEPRKLHEAKKIALMFRSIGIMREAFADADEAERWEAHHAQLWHKVELRRAQSKGRPS